MGLSVSANAGHGLANLFRQARPAKSSDDPAAPADAAATTAVSLRPLGRSGIDSTGSGTAQMAAALTVYLSKLGGPDEAGATPNASAKPTATVRPSPAPAGRSSASDLMRVLDAYGNGDRRLTA